MFNKNKNVVDLIVETLTFFINHDNMNTMFSLFIMSFLCFLSFSKVSDWKWYRFCGNYRQGFVQEIIGDIKNKVFCSQSTNVIPQFSLSWPLYHFYQLYCRAAIVLNYIIKWSSNHWKSGSTTPNCFLNLYLCTLQHSY